MASEGDRAGELENARRTIDKLAVVLVQCEAFFRNQAQMNAAAHLSQNVMYPPIYASIQSAQQAVRMFVGAYPTDEHTKESD